MAATIKGSQNTAVIRAGRRDIALRIWRLIGVDGYHKRRGSNGVCYTFIVAQYVKIDSLGHRHCWAKQKGGNEMCGIMHVVPLAVEID